MKLNILLTGALVSTALAHSDHDGPSMPKLMGARGFLSSLKAKRELPDTVLRHRDGLGKTHQSRTDSSENANLVPRQGGNANGQCGPGVASCATGYCCSPAGFCGLGIEYCAGPDCQLAYGPGCDGNKSPAGSSTSTVARPVLGSIPYGGAGIYDCVNNGDVAFTFDDGPYLYTSDLLDKLKVYNAKATFFITGNNLGKGAIDTTYSSLIQRMITEGHQVASHTWSHQNLSSLDATTFQHQMVYNEMAFRNILGYFPTYMRPPYSDCNSVCQSRLKTLGYHITYFDLDTAGYLNTDPTLIQNSKNIWDAAMRAQPATSGSYLEIEHDIHFQVVYNLTDYILASMYKNGYKSVTVGDCLGDPAANWYRSANGAGTSTTSSAPASSSTAALSISVDGSCGVTTTCQGSTFGNCCSQYGFCGSTVDYCGTGCQPKFGNGCSSSASSTTTTVKPSSTTTAKTSSTSTATKPISTDGTCGTKNTCIGSQWGNCCSQYGFCGNTAAYCGTGCNTAGGTCTKR